MSNRPFKLTDKFISKYQKQKAPFGFNGLGELVYYRTYSRIKEDGSNEQWWETVQRVVEGTYNMQRRHIDRYNLGWNATQAQRSAQEMYDRIFKMKFLPPGRGLWAMGTPLVEEKGLTAALSNCAFVSTSYLKDDPTMPFCFLMDSSMLGVGCGFDTKGAGTILVKGPKENRRSETYSIPDSREGWVESLNLLLESFFLGTAPVEFDYSEIRKAGEPIKGFGGTASGPGPLKDMHDRIRDILEQCAAKEITATCIVDIMNLIGKCVVAGNVRRSAELAIGEPGDEEFLDLKNYTVNPDRAAWGWSSNNSIFAELGMDYSEIAQRIQDNGEPGLIFLENMRKYSRIRNGGDFKDHRAMGMNPCGEIVCEHGELCNLIETFPDHHEDIEDYKRTLKFAYLYGKTVTLAQTHWPQTNRVLLRNRRIGCSMSGIAQFVANHGIHALKEWCESGYETIQHWDQVYSDWLAIPKSIKISTIKPSGSVSLVAGSTPGVHYPESRFCIRRVRLSANSPLIRPLQKGGYNIEPCVGQEDSTVVVEFPIDYGAGVRTMKDVSIWEQFSMAALMQKYWSDNAVSVSVTFDPDKEGGMIEPCLDHFQYQLKGVSLLPRHKDGAYPQMPIEAVTEDQYKEMVKGLKKLNFKKVSGNKAEVERFCDGDTCTLGPTEKKEEESS